MLDVGPEEIVFFLAKQGYIVDAIYFSQISINWAKENAKTENRCNFICDSIFNYSSSPERYDFIYDSGCLHHIRPHRRIQYLEMISTLLKPDGYFGLSCFNQKGGADISDYEVYNDGSMHGGMGYSEHKLRSV